MHVLTEKYLSSSLDIFDAIQKTGLFFSDCKHNNGNTCSLRTHSVVYMVCGHKWKSWLTSPVICHLKVRVGEQAPCKYVKSSWSVSHTHFTYYLQQISSKLAPHHVLAKKQELQLWWQLALSMSTNSITCYKLTGPSVTLRDIKN